MNETSRKERYEHILALIESGQYDDGSDPDMTEEEWDNGETVGVLTEADIRKEINNELTIADIQNGIEKRKRQSRDAEKQRTKQQESRSAEATGK